MRERRGFEGRSGSYYYSGEVTRIAPLGDKHFAANVIIIKRLTDDRQTESISTAGMHEHWGKDVREAETKARREVEGWIRQQHPD